MTSTLTETIAIHVKKFPIDLWHSVRVHAVSNGTDIRDIVIQALREYLERRDTNVDHAP